MRGKQKYNWYIAFCPTPTKTEYVRYKSHHRANSKENLFDAQVKYFEQNNKALEFTRSRKLTPDEIYY